MSFAFTNLKPLNTGRIEDPQVPLGEYLSTMFEQGVHDSMFNSVSKLTEQSLSRSGEELSPYDANRKYGLPTLSFDSPITDGEARLLNERKQAELRRAYYTNYGNPDGFWSKRSALGIGAGFLGSITNPLDFAVNFLPIVGSEAAAAKMGQAGAGAFRTSIARGLITEESLIASRIPFPQLQSSLIEGFVGNGVAEIPHLISALASKENYTWEDSAINIVTGTALGGALHLAVSGAWKAMQHVSSATHEAMFRRALDNALKGEDLDVGHFVKVDENSIRESVKFKDEVAKEVALRNLDPEQVRAAIKEKYHETVEPGNAAFRLPSGEIRKGLHHWLIPMDEAEIAAGFEEGFITNKGRFVSRDEVGRIMGFPSHDLEHPNGVASEQIAGDTSDPDWLTAPQREIFDKLKEAGNTDAEAMNVLRELQLRQSENAFFDKPETQKAIEEETNRRVQEFIEHERQRYDESGEFTKERAAEIQRQIQEGKILKPEDAKAWGFHEQPRDKSLSTLEEDVKAQTKDLEDELKKELEELQTEEKDLFDKIDEKLKGLKIKGDGLMEGVTGMPVWLWNGAIEAVRAAVKAGKSVAEAIEEGVKWIRGQEKETLFHSAIQSELAKDQPFNVKADRFTPQVVMARLKNLPAPEQAMLKMAGIEDFMKQYKPTEMIDREELQKFVDKAIIQPEIKPMLNVAQKTQVGGKEFIGAIQHEMESLGYIFDTEGGFTRPSQPTEGRAAMMADLERRLKIAKEDGDKKLQKEDVLVGEFVSQNVSVPIAFEKMEKPRTIFLAADQTEHVGSSHYEGVFPKGKGKHKNMLAWMETHVVTMPDGRRVLHVFEAQSDVRQSFNTEHTKYGQELPESEQGADAYYLDDQGRTQTKFLSSQKEAQAFVDQKLKEYQEKVQPLIDHTDEILMKAAVQIAKKEGLDGVVISDPRTSMLTQGHLGEIAYQDKITKEFMGERDVLDPLDVESIYEPPSQAGGMTQAYGEKLPSILKKATGKEGEQVDLGGKHYNYEDESFRGEREEGITAGDLPESQTELEEFNKAFPGSDSPSGKFFPVGHLEDKPFGLTTPKQVDLATSKQIEQFKEVLAKKLEVSEKDHAIDTIANLRDMSLSSEESSFLKSVIKFAGVEKKSLKEAIKQQIKNQEFDPFGRDPITDKITPENQKEIDAGLDLLNKLETMESVRKALDVPKPKKLEAPVSKEREVAVRNKDGKIATGKNLPEAYRNLQRMENGPSIIEPGDNEVISVDHGESELKVLPDHVSEGYLIDGKFVTSESPETTQGIRKSAEVAEIKAASEAIDTTVKSHEKAINKALDCLLKNTL